MYFSKQPLPASPVPSTVFFPHCTSAGVVRESEESSEKSHVLVILFDTDCFRLEELLLTNSEKNVVSFFTSFNHAPPSCLLGLVRACILFLALTPGPPILASPRLLSGCLLGWAKHRCVRQHLSLAQIHHTWVWAWVSG